MIKQTLIVLFFALSFNCSVFGQISDSLRDKSYSYLVRKTDSLKHERNSELNWVYLNAYLSKAKRESEFENLLSGYIVGVFHADELKHTYADSVIWAAKLAKDSALIGKAYGTKAGVFYDYREYKEALDLYIQADEILKDYDYSKYNVRYSIGVIKMYLGHFEEASSIIKECKDFFSSKSNNNYNLMYLRTLYRLGEINQLKGQYAEASSYNLLGLKEAINMNQYFQEYYFNFAMGIDDFYAENYELTIRHIKLAIPEIENLGDFDVVEKANYFLGKSYLGLNQEEKALLQFKEVDSLFVKHGFLNPLARGSYEWLIDYYKRQDDKESQLYYINQLLKADQINAINNQQLAYTLNKDYDTKSLKESKAQLEKKFAYWKFIGISIFIVILLIGVFVSIKYFKFQKENKHFRKIYDELMVENKIKTISNFNEEIDENNGVPIEVVDDILIRLNHFEENKDFLNPKVDLRYLAQKFKTNTTYLSKALNSKKHKNFSAYINGLRINYLIELLKSHKKYRSYTIQALSELCGYSSARQFSDAFKSETALRPTFFLEEIQKDESLEEKKV